MTPDQYCQQKASQSGSSFYYSFLFLPPARRRAITALYAFCREVDDVVDECTDVNVARTKLEWWRGQITAVYGGSPASSEQGSRLRDANVRESGAAPSNAGDASVSGVTSPIGARRRAKEGPLWGSDPEGAHGAGVDALMAGSTVASPQAGPRLHVTPAPVLPSDGVPQHPVAQALAAVVTSFKLPRERLMEIIDGMEMDLSRRRYADFAALQVYCHRVASVVGLLSAEIFGYENPRTLKYAEDLGMAFQLTNIIRDVGEDARRDRLYLPLDEIARFNVSVDDIMHARAGNGFRQLMEFQIERALGYYRDAYAALPAVDRKAQRPGLVMAAIYKTLLAEIRADGMPVLTHRTSLTPLRKFWIAWKTWVKG